MKYEQLVNDITRTVTELDSIETTLCSLLDRTIDLCSWQSPLHSTIDHCRATLSALRTQRSDLATLLNAYQRECVQAQQNRLPPCPPGIQSQIDRLCYLWNCIRCRRPLPHECESDAAIHSLPDHKNHLANYRQFIASNLDASARDDATRYAFPDSTEWRRRYDAYIATSQASSTSLLTHIRRKLNDALDERRHFLTAERDRLWHSPEGPLYPRAQAIKRCIIQTIAVIRRSRGIVESEHASAGSVKRVWSECIDVLNTAIERRASRLAPHDYALVALWVSGTEGHDYERARMESARVAELVAMDIYRTAYGNATDLSILQVAYPADGRWKVANIEAAGYLIDVKNARRACNSNASYSEWCVPPRKLASTARTSTLISAFLSPYNDPDPIIWLGEVTARHIDALRDEFNNGLLQIDESFGRTKEYLPPWIFEYPPVVYAGRDNAIRHIRRRDFAWPLEGQPMAVAMVAHRLHAVVDDPAYGPEAMALVARFPESTPITRPRLWLHVLSRFCHAIAGGQEFDAEAVRALLFAPELVSENGDEGDTMNRIGCERWEAEQGAEDDPPREWEKVPLGICDPLKTIASLLSTLETAAVHCASECLRFVGFRLAGPRILRGVRKDGAEQTIVAYCGGWYRLHDGRSVKCGRDPLYLGRHAVCESQTCGRLICDKCGYCSHSCRECGPRQESLARARQREVT